MTTWLVNGILISICKFNLLVDPYYDIHTIMTGNYEPLFLRNCVIFLKSPCMHQWIKDTVEIVKPGLYSMRAYAPAAGADVQACGCLCVATASLGAGNYHQPQLPSANMADSVVGTERYSLFMQKLSTHFGVWGLYMTEYHVCTYWTPPFDLRVATFAARRWGKKRQADGNLQFSKQRMMVIAPLLWW